MSEAPQIIVQGGTQGMRAWVRNIAAMALAADPNRTHQSVKVMGSETAFIRYLGQGRCVIRITGDEARQGIAFQLLHDQEVQPQWYTVVYDAEDREFKIRKTVPPQHDSTWYGTRETDDGTVVERKVHWFANPKDAKQRARLLGAGGPKTLADNERILAAAPGTDGKANLLICRGELGQASQVLARWWASNSGDWQDTPVMDVPAFKAPGGDPRALILCSGFSPDGKKLTVAAQRAGCWDVVFRDGTQPAINRMYDSDVLPVDLLGFTGGQNLEFMKREDIGAPEYLGYFPGTSDGAGYQEEACWLWEINPPSEKDAFTDYAVQRKTVRRRIEIDTLDLQRSNEAPDALMWVKRETDTEQHLHELAQPSLRAHDDQSCDVVPERFVDLKAGLVVGSTGTSYSVRERYVSGVTVDAVAQHFVASIDEFPKLDELSSFFRVDFMELGHPFSKPDSIYFPGIGYNLAGWHRMPPWFLYWSDKAIDGPADYRWGFTYFEEERFPEFKIFGQGRDSTNAMSYADLQWLLDKCVMRTFSGGWKDREAMILKPTHRYIEQAGGAVYRGAQGQDVSGIDPHYIEDRPDVISTTTLFVLDSDVRLSWRPILYATYGTSEYWAIQLEPYVVKSGRKISGYTSNPDLPWAQLEQTTSLNTSHFEVSGKVAKLLKQQAMTTTASIVTEGFDPYESATRKIERTTTLGANTSSEGRAMMTMPVVARLTAKAKVIDNVTGSPVGAAINGFNSPGIADFSMQDQGDKDLVFPGKWSSDLLDSKHNNYYLEYPVQDTLLLREVWAFDNKIGEIRIGERSAGGATERLRYAAVNVSTKDIPIGTGRDQEVGEAQRDPDYGLKHIGYNFGHGGRDVASNGYKGDYYGTASGVVFGYGGAIGSLSSDFISTMVYNSFAAPWAARRSSKQADDAVLLSWMYNYGGDQSWESFEGRVCDIAYSPETQITVVTARGTAHVAHRKDDGTVVHANLLQLLGKANAQGYSRDWWVVNLVEL